MSASDDAETIHRVPGRTTPTWEMELLISGATIIGLLQLPALLDSAFYQLFARSSEDVNKLLSPLWIYAKFSLVTLIATFVLHLFLRGYWVALVGMNSVYPGGIRWGNLRLGPISRELADTPEGEMPATIENADNRATRVFGIGFGLAMLMLLPATLVLTIILIALVVGVVSGHRVDAMIVFSYLVPVVLLPWFIALLLDRRMGDRWPRDSRKGRALRRVLTFYGFLRFGSNNNPLLALFSSHEGTRRAGWTIMLIMAPIFAFVVGQLMFNSGVIDYGRYDGLPESDAMTIDGSQPAFYANQRSEDAGGRAPPPFIPDRVVRGPYLELFVPYLPRRINSIMAQQCPEVAAPNAARTAGLDCLAKLYDIRLDGEPIAVPLEAATDAKSGLRGSLAMIPVRELSPGRHEISVVEVKPRRSSDRNEPQRRYRIPFWK
ncbi:hypothetical protein [Arenimonas sp.]|uniref:hypothetical protein n=1 Tax=Arenimonas sp. TaxID=1872635 RepID=UPI0039E3BC09